MDAFGYEEPAWAVDDDDLFGDGGEGGGDSDENNNNSSDANYGAEHLLLLFDCNHTMFEKYVPCLSEDGEESNLVSPMDVAVTAASQFLRTKIKDIAETKGGKRDGVGVLLYGCDPNRAMRNKRSSTPKSNVASSGDESDEVEELPPTYELIELAPPGIDSVLTMKKCLPPDQPNQKQRDLEKEFSIPPKKEGKMGEDDDDDEDDNDCTLFRGLLAASKVFDNAKCVRNPTTSSKELPDSKAVWIFTNQDDPCHPDMKPRFTNQIKNDFKEANISIHVMPLPKKASSGEESVGDDFNQDIFYNDLTAPYKRVDDFDLKDEETGAVDANVIADRFEMGAKKRRRYASIPLHLPGWKEREDSPGIMLDLYPAVQVRSKPQKVQVHQEKNRETKRRTKRIVTETGEEVRKEDLHHFADFCGRVSLQPANIATMKEVSNSLDDTGMVIHGFRPLKFLPTTNLMSRTILALSNDARVQGSGKALYNLKRSMIKKGVFAVGELLLRKTASSKLVALVAKNDESGSFFIMQLPFKEDLREVPKTDIGFADRKSVDAAKALISKATLHADNVVDALPANPFLQHFFGYLESVSLSKPLLKPEDEAKQDVQMMLDNASEEIEDFKTSLPPDDLPIQKAGVKRKAPAASKPKFEKEPISEEWIDMYKNNEIADLKNDKLKEFLKGQGERMGGKKSDLVDRINRCIQKEVFK